MISDEILKDAMALLVVSRTMTRYTPEEWKEKRAKIRIRYNHYLDNPAEGCVQCQNEKKRGDEFYNKYVSKCDQIKDEMIENGRLRLLLDKHGVDHYY